jgi:hypothetical protein
MNDVFARLSAEEAAFVAAFERGEEPQGGFRHREHLWLAWIYLRELSLLDALRRMSAGLRRFAAARGSPERYHETITSAYLLLVHERMSSPKSGDFEAFARANGDLFERGREVLAAYYSAETLMSARAREHFVLPDGR